MSNLIVRRFLHMSSLLFVVLLSSLAGAWICRADSWKTGDMTTYTQADWSNSQVAPFLLNNYNAVYASTEDVIEIGNPTGFGLIFTNVQQIITYLPSEGPPATLDSSLINPITTASGAFGGDVLALKLNVDFSAAGLLPGSSEIPFGQLVLTGFQGTSFAGLDGITVSQFLALDNLALGGRSTGFSIADLDLLTAQLTGSFFKGYPQTFSQDHLETASTGNPIVTPEPSSLLLWVGLLAVATLHYWWRRGATSPICFLAAKRKIAIPVRL
jgi:hypothetical protein